MSASRTRRAVHAALLLLLPVAPRVAAAQPTASTSTRDDWAHYGRDPGGARFSPLTQVTRENVGRLAVASPPRSGAC